MSIHFIKMHGLGNDYVYIDCFSEDTGQFINKTDISALAQRVSDRHFGIGSDGLVLILPSKEADARMRIFNADGSEAQMCGNAIRCVGKYIYENGICTRPKLMIETRAGTRLLSLHVENNKVKEVTVNMGVPQIEHDSFVMDADPLGFTFVNMGNPHAVFFRKTILTENELADIGQRIGTHPHFPEGINVEFAIVRNARELDVQVWERGSGITLACGTGACAAVVAAIWHGLTEKEVTAHLPGGDLVISQENTCKYVFMTGPATEVFRGEYSINS